MLVHQAHDALGSVTSIGNPLTRPASPPSYRLPPPALGQHTAEIVRGLGFGDDVVSRVLRRVGAPVE